LKICIFRLDEAADIIEDMQILDGHQPTEEQFTIILDAISHSEEYQLGLRCLEKMKSSNVCITEEHLQTVVSAALNCKKISFAENIIIDYFDLLHTFPNFGNTTLLSQ
jgi:hypothetical protein